MSAVAGSLTLTAGAGALSVDGRGPTLHVVRPSDPALPARASMGQVSGPTRVAARLDAEGLPALAALVRDLAGDAHAHALAAISGPDADRVLHFYTLSGPGGACSRLARSRPCLVRLVPVVHAPVDPDPSARSVLSGIAARAGAPPPSRRMAERIADGLWAGASPAEVEAVLSLPPEHRPLGPAFAPDDVAAFRAIAGATAGLAEVLGHRRFLEPARGRWSAYLARLLPLCPPDAAPGGELDAAMAALRARARDLSREALLPAVLGLGLASPGEPDPVVAERDALRCLAEGRGLRAILDLPFPRRGSAGTARGRWPAAFPDFEGPGGVRLTCLVSQESLDDEGRAVPDHSGVEGLEHCVDGYGGRCASGGCVILSARDAAGARLSTVQLDPDGWTVVQHRGRRNADPPDPAVRALHAFLAAVRAGTVRPSPEWLDAAWRRIPADSVPSADPHLAALGLARWGPCLPRPLRDRAALASRWSKRRLLPRAAPPQADAVPVRTRDTGARDVGILLAGLACLPAMVVVACVMATTGELSGRRPPPCLARRAASQLAGASLGLAGLTAMAIGAAADGHPDSALFLLAWSLLAIPFAAVLNRRRLIAWARSAAGSRAKLRRARGVLLGRIAPGSTGREVYVRRI